MSYDQQSVLGEYILDPIVNKLTAHPYILRSKPELWLGVSFSYSVLIFFLLWIDVGYWPWWMFLLLWVTTHASMLSTRLGFYLLTIHDKTLAFQSIYWAHNTFSTHVCVLGALHVLNVGSWGTLLCSSILCMQLYAPHWLAILSGDIRFGKWTSPNELRSFSTTFALVFSPFHFLLQESIHGSIFSIGVCMLLLIPLFRIFRDAFSFVSTLGQNIIIVLHFGFSLIPVIGMLWWALNDPWLASTAPITFSGILIMLNTQGIARSHFDRCSRRELSLLTPLEFLPFLGVANTYLQWIGQPLSIFIVYFLSSIFTGFFLLRVAIHTNSNDA